MLTYQQCYGQVEYILEEIIKRERKKATTLEGGRHEQPLKLKNQESENGR